MKRETAGTCERGTTLVELMIGLLVATGVITAAYGVMATSQEAATINAQTLELQQSVRVAMAIIAQDMKVAGFGMIAPVGACGAAVVPADQAPGGPDTGSDSVSLVVPTTLAALASPAASPGNILTLEAGSIADATLQGFAVGAAISISGSVTATVTAINGDVLTVAVSLPPSALYPTGTMVYWLRCIRYAISTDANLCCGPPPCLVRGPAATPAPVTQGIEDLQLAYACDGCTGGPADGRLDDQNGSNTFDDGDFISNSAWAVSPATPDTIRLVRLSLVGRQMRPDPWWHESPPLIVEDHNPAADPGFDQQSYKRLRRRLLTRVIDIRNSGP